MPLRDAILLDYWFKEAIASVMPFVDKVIVNEGYSIDSTYNELLGLKDIYGDKLIINRHTWVFVNGIYSKIWMADYEKVDTDWVMLLGADECWHQNQYDMILRLIHNPRANYLNHHWIHLSPHPDHIIKIEWQSAIGRTGDFRVFQKGHEQDCPCWKGMVARGNTNDGGIMTDINVFHYGLCRDWKSYRMKQARANATYSNSNEYADGHLSADIDTTVDCDWRVYPKHTFEHPKVVMEKVIESRKVAEKRYI